MKIHNLHRFLLLLVVMTLVCMQLTAQERSATCWPGFRGDEQLTGFAAATLKPPLRLLWTFKTGDAIKSSAVVCNGTIFIGSNDGFLYALSSTGNLLWKFDAKNPESM